MSSHPVELNCSSWIQLSVDEFAWKIKGKSIKLIQFYYASHKEQFKLLDHNEMVSIIHSLFVWNHWSCVYSNLNLFGHFSKEIREFVLWREKRSVDGGIKKCVPWSTFGRWCTTIKHKLHLIKSPVTFLSTLSDAAWGMLWWCRRPLLLLIVNFFGCFLSRHSVATGRKMWCVKWLWNGKSLEDDQVVQVAFGRSIRLLHEMESPWTGTIDNWMQSLLVKVFGWRSRFQVWSWSWNLKELEVQRKKKSKLFYSIQQ